jgi:uncharacterized protein (DUF1330 family)
MGFLEHGNAGGHMQFQNANHPSPEQVKEFLAVDGPVLMVNLLRFREKAAYPDGSDSNISGQAAYQRYAAEMHKLVHAAGGRFVFSSNVAGLLIGEVEELWDVVAIVEYPSSRALLQIASSPDFADIERHRLAGLAGQLNITSTGSPFENL